MNEIYIKGTEPTEYAPLDPTSPKATSPSASTKTDVPHRRRGRAVHGRDGCCCARRLFGEAAGAVRSGSTRCGARARTAPPTRSLLRGNDPDRIVRRRAPLVASRPRISR